MELMTVIGIIAILCAVAIPSYLTISRSLQFRQRNDYARSIFLAAQTALTERRSQGSLKPLQADADGNIPTGSAVIPDTAGFPSEGWSTEYLYTSSTMADKTVFDMVLPAGSVDATLRDEQIIIEYNPYTGNVYSVFFSTEEAPLDYEGGLPRDDAAARKDMMLGYYCGDGLGKSTIELERSTAVIVYDNGEEALLTVRVPVPELYYSRLDKFARGLNVDLTLTGDRGGSYTVNTKTAGVIDPRTCSFGVDGRTILVTYLLDSLYTRESFVNHSTGLTDSLTALATEKEAFYGGADVLPENVQKILPGDNLTVSAMITFTPAAGDPSVEVEPGILAGINPMFESLQDTGEGKFVLTLSNGRNLQNLNAIAPSVARDVETVVFSDDIYWNRTADYYADKYTDPAAADEAPARSLPYFVPIHSDALFGTARFVVPGFDVSQDTWLGNLLEQIFGSFWERDKYVPTLTDEIDKKMVGTHATIQGNNKAVYNLDIDANTYTVPTNLVPKADGTGEIEANSFYASGNQLIDNYFTGLFGYVNTTIDNLSVVNPIIKGHAFDDSMKRVPVYLDIPIYDWHRGEFVYPIVGYRNLMVRNNPASGALVGATGYSTLITNCSAYIDKTAEGYSAGRMSQTDFNAAADQNWYGVSGEGAVGGLVGYAKSHRTVTGELTGNKAHLAFSKSFAALPVSGNMRTDMSIGDGSGKVCQFGYSNGVGGLVGNSQLSNFYSCYASGSVRANGGYLEERAAGFLPYDSKTSIGAGGFVGTSHGTRYTNCFASGNVRGSDMAHDGWGESVERDGVGGFVGVMCLNETKTYGNGGDRTPIAQQTVFTDCYSVGRATAVVGESEIPVENFSGANARLPFGFNITDTLASLMADYYRLYAYHYKFTGEVPSYEDFYMYRNTFYLSQYYDGAQENSNSCANPALYSTLQDLPGSHQNESWRNQRISDLKGAGGLLELWWGPMVESLRGQYHRLYSGGYQSGWGPASEATTHPYNLAAGARYPFSMLEGMDYYGDWPNNPSAMGLGYYERYRGESADAMHLYFDRDETSRLSNEPDTVVAEDGYAVLSARENEIRVWVGSSTDAAGNSVEPYKLTAQANSFDAGGNAYHVYPLTDEVRLAAEAEARNKNEFYVKLILNDGSRNFYTVYYNPNLALTQVNAPNQQLEAQKPQLIPTQLYVRSARQLANLGSMPYAWGPEYHYVQMLNVDGTTLTADGKPFSPAAAIGNAAVPFEGSYDGSLGYVSQAAVNGFAPASGFFGELGANSKLKDVNITIPANDLAIGSAEQISAGLVAAHSKGRMENVDLTLEGAVTLTAKDQAGLLAGLMEGPIRGCDIHAKQPVTVNAASAGLAVGKLAAAEPPTGGAGTKPSAPAGVHVDRTTLTADRPCSLSGSRLGGFAGVSSGVTYESMKVTLNGLTGTGADKNAVMGGFAGTLDGGSVTTLNIQLHGANGLTGEKSLVGGAAGQAGMTARTLLSNINVTLNEDGLMKGLTLGGLFGQADAVTVTRVGVNLNGQLQAAETAAGAAGVLGEQSSVDNSAVNLYDGSIVSEGMAAGFVSDLKGHVQQGWVILNGEGSPLTAKTKAAGFANTVSGKAENAMVSGHGQLTAEHAAGFVNTLEQKGRILAGVVTPVKGHDNSGYLGEKNENLLVNGSVSSAGFAGKAESGSEITNASVLCALGKGASGFVGSNSGHISGSTANVDLSDGHAFAGANLGQIRDCYGWYGSGKADQPSTLTVTAGEMGSCRSSYFVNLQQEEGVAAFFDKNGSFRTMDLSQLCSQTVLEELNDSVIRWFTSEKFRDYPYTAGKLVEKDYPYPMLGDHYGDWMLPIVHSYGVAYYEQYEDGSWKLRLQDLIDPSLAAGGKDLTGYYQTDTEGKLVRAETNVFNKDGTILKTGYALFCKEGKAPFDKGLLGSALAQAPVLPDSTLKLHELKLSGTDPVLKLTDMLKNELTVHTHYAQAFNVADNTYEIRTAEQFGHVTAGKSFHQTHDLTLTNYQTVENFDGVYDGNGCIISLTQVNKPLFGHLTGTVKNATVQAESAVNTPAILAESTEKATITGCAVNIPHMTLSGPAAGGLVGSMNGGKLEKCTVTGAITGNAAVLGGAVGSDSGKAVYTNVTANADITSVGGTVGQFVGTVTNGQFTDCKAHDKGFEFLGSIKAKTSALPEGTFANGTKYDPDHHAVSSTTEAFEGFVPADGKELTHFDAVLKNCTFGMKQQVIRPKEYYYSGLISKLLQKYAVGQVSAELGTEQSLRYRDFWENNEITDSPTDFFWKNDAGEYHRVYLTRTARNSSKRRTIILKTANGTKIVSKEFRYQPGQQSFIKDKNDENMVFVTAKTPVLDAKLTYILVGEDGKIYTGTTAIPFNQPLELPVAQTKGVLWTPNGTFDEWKNGTEGKLTGEPVFDKQTAEGTWFTIGKTRYRIYTGAVDGSPYYKAAFTLLKDEDGSPLYSEECAVQGK